MQTKELHYTTKSVVFERDTPRPKALVKQGLWKRKNWKRCVTIQRDDKTNNSDRPSRSGAKRSAPSQSTWYSYNKEKHEKLRRTQNSCCSATAQKELESLFVFLIKDIVASRIFRLLTTVSGGSPNRSNSQKDLSLIFNLMSNQEYERADQGDSDALS